MMNKWFFFSKESAEKYLAKKGFKFDVLYSPVGWLNGRVFIPVGVNGIALNGMCIDGSSKYLESYTVAAHKPVNPMAGESYMVYERDGLAKLKKFNVTSTNGEFAYLKSDRGYFRMAKIADTEFYSTGIEETHSFDVEEQRGQSSAICLVIAVILLIIWMVL